MPRLPDFVQHRDKDKNNKTRLKDDETPHPVKQQATSVRELVSWHKEGRRPKEIERKVLGQRLSEIYPHSEACNREDAGS